MPLNAVPHIRRRPGYLWWLCSRVRGSGTDLAVDADHPAGPAQLTRPVLAGHYDVGSAPRDLLDGPAAAVTMLPELRQEGWWLDDIMAQGGVLLERLADTPRAMARSLPPARQLRHPRPPGVPPTGLMDPPPHSIGLPSARDMTGLDSGILAGRLGAAHQCLRQLLPRSGRHQCGSQDQALAEARERRAAHRAQISRLQTPPDVAPAGSRTAERRHATQGPWSSTPVYI